MATAMVDVLKQHVDQLFVDLKVFVLEKANEKSV